MKNALNMTPEEIKTHLLLEKKVERKRREYQRYLELAEAYLSEQKDKVSLEQFLRETKIPRSTIWFAVKVKDISKELLEKLEVPEDWK